VTAFDERDNTRALELHQQYFQVFRKLFICSNPIPLKYCLNRIGLNVGPCRLPLVEASGAHQAALDKMLQEIGLI
ncbi:MAG: 4-hydroxy-tetrahydrodipicolinate synthase, partial [Clostridia bacterium]|nr:4-hydroxy-tetrahydrodipicolinate synthase [Clostridia bacterium]